MQHVENAHRAPLLQREQLGVVEQLSAFGMSAAQIAKRTKIKRDTVKTALAVTKSDLAKAATNRYDFLTLEQAAVVAEFDDDSAAVKELIVAAQKGYGFDHLVNACEISVTIESQNNRSMMSSLLRASPLSIGPAG